MDQPFWRVLLIDDDEDDYMLTRSLVSEARGRKISLAWASTYEKGREQIRQNNYDAVLVDYDLGARTGIELIREMASDGYHAPAILYTGRGSYEVDLEAMQAGATLYLTKGEANPLLLERAIRYAIELKQKEQALRASEEKFSKAFHTSPDALILSRYSDGLIQEVNPAFEQIFGYRRSEAVGKTSLALGLYVDPQDRRRMLEQMDRDGHLREHELQVRRKSGETRVASISVEQMDVQADPYILTILRDVTEQKQMEQALRESEERYRVALMNFPAVYAQTDRELRYVWIRYPHSDFSPGQVIGKRDDELEDTEDMRRLVALKRRVLESGQGLRQELTFVRSDGLRTYDMTIEPLRGADGEICGVTTAALDITDRRQTERALQESERTLEEAGERFHSLADAMPQLVWTALPDGTVDYYNRRYMEYNGIAPGGGEAWQWSPVLHPDDLERTMQAWTQAVQSGTVYQAEHRVQMADGSYRWHLSRGVPVRDAQGSIIRWYGTATDIHDLKQVQEELQQALHRAEEGQRTLEAAEGKLQDYAARLARSNQELQNFAYVASHDLKEPLRKIIRFGEILQSRLDGLDDSEKLDPLQRMLQAAGRMRDMVDKLLELSQVNTSGGAIERVDLSQLAQEVLEDLEAQLHQSNGQVTVGPLPQIDGDPFQLRRLLQNLLANALKFHKPGVPPLVRISAEVSPTTLTLRVEDNGIGLDEQYANQIFQPFSRLHGRGEYEGTGMGLAICRRIVERHQGSITVCSRPGEGTTFVVELPLEQKP